MINSIEKILAGFESDSSSEFCSKVVTPFDDMSIHVKDVGDIHFPIKPKTVKALIKQSRPARYGLKEQTLLDKDVRDVWEIPKTRVKIDQRRWKKSFDGTLSQLEKALGISEASALKAQLHNLIIYEPGQFFKPHQDSEKSDGMVATLVVLLPSYYRGGTLIVDHQGEKKCFTSRSCPEDKLTFIAFYADCYHEVRPVTEGYRVALTYNLILKDSANSVRAGADKVIHKKTQQELSVAINEYFENTRLNQQKNKSNKIENKKFVYLLDHEYTAKGLHWSRLKNNDGVRVNALKEIADKLDLNIYLSLIDVHECWDCQDNTDWECKRHRYWEYEEEIEYKDEESETENFTLLELIDSDVALNHSINLQGDVVTLSGLHIGGNEICWTRAMDKFKPFESEYEGYMGNWGNTMDHWYHRAAIVMWRKIDHYLMLLESSPKEFLDEIFSLVKNRTELANVKSIVSHVLPNWRGSGNDESPKALSRVLQLAIKIESPELASQLVKPLGQLTISKASVPILIELAECYGAQWCTDSMQEWLSPEYDWDKKLVFVNTLFPIVNVFGKQHSRNADILTNWLLKYQLKTLKQDFSADLKTRQQAELDKGASTRTKILIDLMQATIVAKDNDVHDKLMSYIIENENLFPAIELASVLLKTKKDCKGSSFAIRQYERLKSHTLRLVNEALSRKPRRVDDWSINDENNCSCEDCRQLKQFLQAPDQVRLKWPLAKRRRQHIHQIIDTMRLPVKHITERVGSPHKLLLTKTDQLFKREIKLRKAYEGVLLFL